MKEVTDMGAFEHFPYANYHDLNLDWIVEKIKELEQEIKDLQARVEELEGE